MASGDTTTIGEYEYFGDTRRSQKVVSNTGEESTPNDGGDTTVVFYYGNPSPKRQRGSWSICETPRGSSGRVAAGAPAGRWSIYEPRNGSSQTTMQMLPGNRDEQYYYAGWRVIEERDSSGDVLAQTVYSTEYIDAPVCRDRNTDVDSDEPDDPNACLDAGSARYFYHQGPNYRVWALTDENGDVVERYDYDAYGEPRIYAGEDSTFGGEVGRLLTVSSVGNPYMHQGLRRDDETGLHENRHRAYNSGLGRFIQRDPAAYADGMNLYECVRGAPLRNNDPTGRTIMDPPKEDPPKPLVDDPEDIADALECLDHAVGRVKGLPKPVKKYIKVVLQGGAVVIRFGANVSRCNAARLAMEEYDQQSGVNIQIGSKTCAVRCHCNSQNGKATGYDVYCRGDEKPRPPCSNNGHVTPGCESFCLRKAGPWRK